MQHTVTIVGKCNGKLTIEHALQEMDRSGKWQVA